MYVYISAPITNVENHNIPLFAATQEIIESYGHSCFNPTRACGFDWSWEKSMKACIAEMMKADLVLFLPGWKLSAGCRIENYLAKNIHIRHFYVERGKDFDHQVSILQKQIKAFLNWKGEYTNE